ncbi:fibronectin type III domain-containing protein [Natrinema salaciae]|uniref:PKD domain-containing protein n=1 Tax=Natrinema salaciae TaxID=1186196 RepID=A0A1H9IH05_9EURY|nr:fibronectin type III domain-containing protein [Natrinema salaciae]SEQ73864.1 PKD domain-containing protein [Natrinema salaciae]
MTDNIETHDEEQFAETDRQTSASTSRRNFIRAAGASAAVLATGTSAVAAQEDLPTVTVDLADAQLAVGASTTATVRVENSPAGSLGASIEVAVDPAVAQITEIELGEHAPSQLEDTINQDIEDAGGAVSSIDAQSFDGNGIDETAYEIATLHLKGRGDGATEPELADFSLTPPDGGLVEEAVYDAPTLTVGEGPGEPVTPTVTVDLAAEQVDPGETTTVGLGLNSAPNGLSGFNLEVSVDTAVATITDAALGGPFADSMFNTVDVTDGTATLEAVQEIEAGATGVTFGTVELEGAADGETAVDVAESETLPIENIDGEPVGPEIEEATLTVGDGEPDDEPPSVPQDLEVVAENETSVEIAWSPVSDAVEYAISVDGEQETTTTSTTATITELEADTTYEIGVSAVGENGAASDEATVEATTAAGEGPGTPTVTVDLADAQIDPGETTTVDLGLTVAPNGLSGFNVQTSVDTDVATIVDAELGGPFADSMFNTVEVTDETATLEAAQEVEAGATDVAFGTVELEGAADGETVLDVTESETLPIENIEGEPVGPEIEEATLTVGDGEPDDEPPSVPQNLQVVTVDETSIEISWSPDPNAVEYVVYVDGAQETTTTTSSATVSGLEAGTTYEIGVSAVGESETETDTATVSATTDEADDGDGDNGDSEYPEWDPDTLYEEGDRVHWNGEDWEAQWTNQGTEPKYEEFYAWEPVDGEIPIDVEYLAKIDPSATSVEVGERIDFHVTDNTTDQNWVEQLAWDLGDGTSASGWYAGHAYDSSGTYTVSLTATDQRGRQTTHTVEITVA